MRQGDQGVDDNLAFLSAFQDEVADFHMACADSGATDAAERVLSHVGTLRAMVSDAEGDDAAMLKEMHAACVAKAAAWVERRIQDLVAQFHLRWHDDGDLLAVDCALRESMTLVRHAEAELGPLPVCVEVLGGCDQQLCTKLAEHVRRANRHELRMLFADFCQWVGREELQQLCLDKYREQVDKHVQSEAVATQIKLLNLLQAKSLRTSVGGTNGVGASAGAGAVAGAGGGGGGGPGAGALVTEDGSGGPVQVLREYLEGVAGLKEELCAAELPPSFATSVLREVEQEACTQALELASQVLDAEAHLRTAHDAVQRHLDHWPARQAGTDSAGTPGGGSGSGGSGGGGGRGGGRVQLELPELDAQLEDTSALLLLLQSFEQWCEEVDAEQQAIAEANVVTIGAGTEGAGVGASEAAATGAAPAAAFSEDDGWSLRELASVADSGRTVRDAASAAGSAAAAAASACSSALQMPSLPPPPSATRNEALPPPPPPPRAAASVAGAPSASRAQPKPARTSARVKLETYCQTLACAYSAGEAAYLGCAVRLAMEMAEADRESLTLSVVDDGFFVLLKAFGRAVRSGAATLAVVPLLHSMVDAIRTLIAPVLGRYVRQAGLADAANEPFLIAVNSLQCAEEYTRKLRSVVSSAFEERFNGLVGLADAAQSELDGIADDLKEDAAKELRHLGASLLPAVWLRMEFEPTSYVLAAEQAELDAKRSFESGLLRPLREALEPLKDRLRAVNFESLVHTLAAGLAEELEAAVMHKRFDEAGAILLGEHSRQLTDNLSELLVSGSVRNEFGRLNQIAFLLTAGSVQEAAALLLSTQSAAAGPGARLTRAEAARALVLRKEFTMAEVREILPELDDEDEG
jgi:hypothetical protein